jgi:hypothetical protein
MGWVELALAVFKLIFRSWDVFNERNKEVKEKKVSALNEVKTGIQQKDASSITRGFDKLSRL